MRYRPEHKATTRDRIVAAASRRFRERGYAAAGVDGVMAAAGLTAGGFYAHFRSKADLLGATLASAARQMRANLLLGLDDVEGVPWLREVARRYLSRVHRDHPAEGCALPALSAEVARLDAPARAAFEHGMVGLLAELEPKMPEGGGLSREDRALATAALFAGGIMLSRAVEDPELSDRILMACRRFAVPEDAPPGAGESS